MTDAVLDPTDAATAWADSGMMFLTGRAGGPALGAPAALVDLGRTIAADTAQRTARLGRPVLVDPLATMADRAASAGHRRAGQVSCGGSSRLMRCADGWVAATMARPDDWDLLAALFECSAPVVSGEWATVQTGVAALCGAELTVRAERLGLPLSVLGERHPPAGDSPRPPGTPGDGPGLSGIVPGITMQRIGSGSPVRSLTGLVVADLSALWAGPLVGRLLARAGGRVIKVESASRPDGVRLGDPRFHAAMNEGKESVVLELGRRDGRQALHRILSNVDVIITASRPRALDQLGLDPEDLVRRYRPRAWLMISGYGGANGSSHRVAFGDDAAVAGGLVAWDGPTPCFCGDAVADPLTGLAATAAVLAALESDGEWIIEASMADIAAGASGPPLSVGGLSPIPPRLSPVGCDPVPGFGADTAAVLAEFGVT